MNFEDAARDILSKVEQHTAYRYRCLNLIASENVTSPLVRSLLASDLGHRYAIGFLYTRVHRGCRYVDELEETTNYLLKTLFKAEHVNYVPVSGTVANLVMFNALAKPGDTAMALSVMDGGHSSFRECSKIRGVSMVPLPLDQERYNIDVDEASKLISRVRPKVVLFGASDFLFPHPVVELAQTIKENEGIVAYDAAHVLGLIAGGCFQDPLREGAEVVTGSTHKTFFGPQGGIILCNRKHSENIDHSAWQMVNNHHIHRVAALALATVEMLEFGRTYAAQVVRNAKALAEKLYNLGIEVLCPDLGFTESHQVIVDVGEGRGQAMSRLLEDANIITNQMPLPWDRGEEFCSGIRLGVQEVTRMGMGEEDMAVVAELIADVLLGKHKPQELRERVESFVGGFQEVKCTFKQEEARKLKPNFKQRLTPP